MSSGTQMTPVFIRVKRRTDEEKTVPNKKCKFVATCDSPKDNDIYQLLTKTKPLPQTNDYNNIQIKDLEDLNINKTNKIKDIITCNGQPLDSVQNRLEDSLEYIYDIYIADDKDFDDIENTNHYREYEDSEEDSNDENYAYNDYPDDNEVSDDVIDYYSYRDDTNDLRDNFDQLSDEDMDVMERYRLKNCSLNESTEKECDD